MNRLTIDGWCKNGVSPLQAVKKLSKYEDTGLTPSEVKALIDQAKKHIERCGKRGRIKIIKDGVYRSTTVLYFL